VKIVDVLVILCVQFDCLWCNSYRLINVKAWITHEMGLMLPT